MVVKYSETTNQMADGGVTGEALKNVLSYLVVRAYQGRRTDKGIGGSIVAGGWDGIMFGLWDYVFTSFIEGQANLDVFGFKVPLLHVKGTQYESANRAIRELEFYAEKWVYVTVMSSLAGATTLTKMMSNAEAYRYALAYGLRAITGVQAYEGWENLLGRGAGPEPRFNVPPTAPPATSTMADAPSLARQTATEGERLSVPANPMGGGD